MGKKITKIIYFDKETIKNILQEQNKGDRQTQIETSISSQATTEVEAEASVKLNMPVALRLSFLFTGKIGAKFLIKRESETTITSTEISEFEKLKSSFVEMENIKVADIKNSSTSFRVAGSYLRFIKGQIDDVDVKEFNLVMNGFEGYDTYKVNEKCYVRFNNTAFVSNYKRNDLLSTNLTLYCINVGYFAKETFDFIKQIFKMKEVFGSIEQDRKLADVYPPNETDSLETTVVGEVMGGSTPSSDIALYDVVYACISLEGDRK